MSSVTSTYFGPDHSGEPIAYRFGGERFCTDRCCRQEPAAEEKATPVFSRYGRNGRELTCDGCGEVL